MKRVIELLAIIPARGGSKGLPGKNIRNLNGRPMINYTIEAAFASDYVQEVIVSTDDKDIARLSQEAGVKVPSLRPEYLATDETKIIEVIQHVLFEIENNNNCIVKNIMLLQPTSPLRNNSDIDEAYRLYIESGAESLQSVTEAPVHPYILRRIRDNQLIPYLNNNEDNLRRQDVEPLFQLNGAIYICKRDLIINKNSIIGDYNIPYIMPLERSVDIDNLYDFKLVEFILQG